MIKGQSKNEDQVADAGDLPVLRVQMGSEMCMSCKRDYRTCLTPEQIRALKIRAAKLDMSASDLLGKLIEEFEARQEEEEKSE